MRSFGHSTRNPGLKRGVLIAWLSCHCLRPPSLPCRTRWQSSRFAVSEQADPSTPHHATKASAREMHQLHPRGTLFQVGMPTCAKSFPAAVVRILMGIPGSLLLLEFVRGHRISNARNCFSASSRCSIWLRRSSLLFGRPALACRWRPYIAAERASCKSAGSSRLCLPAAPAAPQKAHIHQHTCMDNAR